MLSPWTRMAVETRLVPGSIRCAPASPQTQTASGSATTPTGDDSRAVGRAQRYAGDDLVVTRIDPQHATGAGFAGGASWPGYWALTAQTAPGAAASARPAQRPWTGMRARTRCPLGSIRRIARPRMS